jgi:hypothetical protein
MSKKLVCIIAVMIMLIATPVSAAGVQSARDIVDLVVQNYRDSYEAPIKLDTNKAQKTLTSDGQVRVIIPIIDSNYDEYANASFLVADTRKSKVVSLKKMTIKKEINHDAVKTTIAFSEADGSNLKAGVYINGELSDVYINGKAAQLNGEPAYSAASSDQSVIDCLIEAFNALPWYLQAACTGACGGIFTGNAALIAVCAGCIFGSGANNDCL